MINRVILIGNLGADPEIRSTPSGQTVATFNVATSRSWKDKAGDRQTETEWHRVVIFGTSAEFCGNYLEKGSKIYVEGRLKTRKWKDSQGADRYTTEIIAATVQNLSPRLEGQSQTNQAEPYGGFGGGTGEDVPR